jgi:hypothetical protein
MFDEARRVIHPASEGLEPVLDPAPARWVVDALPDFAARVAGSLVPAGYDMYVRVVQPAPRRGDAQPSTGNLSDRQLDGLIPLLARATTAAATCWFCLWDGFGFLHPGSISVAGAANPWSDPPGEPWRGGLDVSALPRLHLPNRDYLMFRGPVSAARLVGRELGPYALPWREGPNLWWPDDRAWVVASEIDLDSTYIACAAPLGAALLASDALDCFAASPDDPFGFDSDRVSDC